VTFTFYLHFSHWRPIASVTTTSSRTEQTTIPTTTAVTAETAVMTDGLIMNSYRRSARSLWDVLFRIEGNVFFAVLPFCMVNCALLGLVALYKERGNFGGISATGHGLLTLLVSFLVISKVNLAYDRYRAVRNHAGDAYRELRELVQAAIAVSTSSHQRRKHPEDDGEMPKELQRWRTESVSRVKGLMDATKRTLQDRSLAVHLALNKIIFDGHGVPTEEGAGGDEDPMTLVHGLRMHLYCSSHLGMDLLERVNMVGKLQEFALSFNRLLILASTPLPFPLVQMGRAFLFLWTFSMPLVLLDGPFSDFWTAQVFLFFLTYGFIGLELVSMKLADPFGDGPDDVQLGRIHEATLAGMDRDLRDIPLHSLSQRRLGFSQQKERQQQRRRPDDSPRQHQQQQHPPEKHGSMHDDAVAPQDDHHSYGYHAMPSGAGGSNSDFGHY
jgi:predicted membrane chloride channel (bestrophin family)